MGNVFGERKTLKQIIREQQRMVNKSVRSLERERAGLERTEKKLISDIKVLAKKGEMKSCKIMAKDLVRIRKHQSKFINLTSQLRAISLQMTAMASTQQLTESMKSVTRSMMALNRQVNLPQLQKVMAEFAKQAEMMDMKQEIMGDSIEDAMEDDEDEEESEQVVNQVLDEIGITLNEQLVDAPGAKPKVEEKKEVAEDADKELEARLNNLKR